jgi:hypothetical protein
MVFENNSPSIVGAGFPRPIAWIIELGGENPPLRPIVWGGLILKDRQPTVGASMFLKVEKSTTVSKTRTRE